MQDYLKKLFSKSGDASMVPIAVLVLIILIIAFAVIYSFQILNPGAGVNLPVINTHISFLQMLIGAMLVSVGITGIYEYQSNKKLPTDADNKKQPPPG